MMGSITRELETGRTKRVIVDRKRGGAAAQMLLLGLQQVMAMDLFIPPMILAGMLSFSVNDSALLIQMTFIACGLATLIQAGLAMKLPVMQGPSFVPISALAAIGTTSGIGTMIGSLIPGALLIGLLGYPLQLFSKAVRRFIPPLVAGTVIVIVGISLMPSAIHSIYTAQGSLSSNMIVAIVTAAVLIFCMYIGEKSKTKLRFIKVISVILALASGSLVASFYGLIDFSSVEKASWFQLPTLFAFGMPTFNINAILILLAIYLIVMIETTGTWFTVSNITGDKLDDKRLNGGALGEGLGCFLGSFLGGTPVTGYSSNAGIIAITGIKSRKPILVGGAILIVLGMMPKLMNCIACIPSVVVNSIFAILCVVIMMNGFKVIKEVPFTERNMLVIGVSIMAALFAVLMPADILAQLPDLATYFVASGTAVGAVTALLLNLILPESIEDHKESNEVQTNLN